MKKSVLFVIVLAGLGAVLSCNKQERPVSESAAKVVNARPEGKKVQNPYSLEVMQEALDLLLSTKAISGNVTLEATDYYVKIHVADTSAVRVLKESDIELFDYPLDCEYEENTEYYYEPEDLEANVNEFCYYTVVATERIPDKIPYETLKAAKAEGRTLDVSFKVSDSFIKGDLIEECYIPENHAAVKSGTELPVSPEELERMAFSLAGVEYSEPETKASFYPSGTIYVDNSGTDIPVKGVKVRIQRLLKWNNVYTDDNGEFLATKKFNKANISVIFSNRKDFDVWGNWAFVAPATYTIFNLATSPSLRYCFEESKAHAPWSWAVTNNAAYDYYVRCASTSGAYKGMTAPPKRLKLWCMNIKFGTAAGSAPMLHHLVSVKILSGVSGVVSFCAGFGFVPSVALSLLILSVGPDVWLGTNGVNEYKKLYSTVSHELVHAAHFSVMGEINYGKLMLYEIANFVDSGDMYGNGTSGTEGEKLCELAETCAYSIENYIRKNILSLSSVGYAHFFEYNVKALTEILTNGILTPGEVWKTISKTTPDMNTLFDDLKTKYPLKEAAIDAVMSAYGL